MKKYTVLLCLSLLCGLPTGTFAAVEANGCAQRNGDLLTGDEAPKYCKSRILMNWWSAFAWCKSMNGTLVDLTVDCLVGKYVSTNTTQCPYLTSLGGSDTVWTQNVPDASYAYHVSLSSGAVASHARDNLSGAALCRLP